MFGDFLLTHLNHAGLSNYLCSRSLPSLKLTVRIWKWMVGIRLFPFGMAYFQVRTVSFREGYPFLFWELKTQTPALLERALFHFSVPKSDGVETNQKNQRWGSTLSREWMNKNPHGIGTNRKINHSKAVWIPERVWIGMNLDAPKYLSKRWFPKSWDEHIMAS